MKCPRCRYEWEPRAPQPKECPRCKQRLDYWAGLEPAGASIKKRGEEKMASKIPWVAAAIIIVVAAIGAWATLKGAPAAPPTGYAAVTARAAPGKVFGLPPGSNSGILYIHIMRNGGTWNMSENLSTYPVGPAQQRLGVISTSGGTANIPYGVAFDIVVDVVGHDDNMAYVQEENLQVWLAASGDITITGAYSTNAEEDNYMPVPTSSRIYANVRKSTWQNKTLLAGQSMSLDNVSLELWG